MNIFILLISFLQFLVSATHAGEFHNRRGGAEYTPPSDTQRKHLVKSAQHGGGYQAQSNQGQSREVFRSSATVEIQVTQESGATRRGNDAIKEIQLLSRINEMCNGRNVKATIEMGTRKCSTNPREVIMPDQLIRWNQRNGQLDNCQNFNFGDGGHIYLEAPQSFLQNCISTVDIVLQNGKRYISRTNSGWGSSQGTSAVQWIVPTAPPRTTPLACPDSDLSCPKKDLQMSGWSAPESMQCFPEPDCEYVSDTNRSLNPQVTSNTGFKCYPTDKLTPNIEYCCQSKQVEINGVVTIPQCGDNQQRRTPYDGYLSSELNIGSLAIFN